MLAGRGSAGQPARAFQSLLRRQLEPCTILQQNICERGNSRAYVALFSAKWRRLRASRAPGGGLRVACRTWLSGASRRDGAVARLPGGRLSADRRLPADLPDWRPAICQTGRLPAVGTAGWLRVVATGGSAGWLHGAAEVGGVPGPLLADEATLVLAALHHVVGERPRHAGLHGQDAPAGVGPREGKRRGLGGWVHAAWQAEVDSAPISRDRSRQVRPCATSLPQAPKAPRTHPGRWHRRPCSPLSMQASPATLQQSVAGLHSEPEARQAGTHRAPLPPPRSAHTSPCGQQS